MANQDDFGHVASIYDGIADEIAHVTDAELAEVAHLAVNIITLRTKAGVDVDGKPFEKYAEEYAAERVHAGLGTSPDLARTGHMLGAMLAKVDAGDAVVRFANPSEETKAAAHNEGVSKTVGIDRHSVSGYTRKVQRYSTQELRDKVERARRRYHRSNSDVHLDSLVKARNALEQHLGGKVAMKRQKVSGHEKGAHDRRMNLPKREFFDIRQPREVELLYEPLGAGILGRITKSVK